MEVKIGFLFVSIIPIQEALSKALYHFIGPIIIVKIREIPLTNNRLSYDFDIDQTNHQVTIFIASSHFLTNIPQFMSNGNHSNLLPIHKDQLLITPNHKLLHSLLSLRLYACSHKVYRTCSSLWCSMNSSTRDYRHKKQAQDTKNYKTKTWNRDMTKNKLA